MERTGIATVTVVVIVFALSCLLLLLSLNMPAPALAQEDKPKPDLIITEINAYHYDTSCSPWFNLENEVDVTVENIGDAEAEAFYVNLSVKAADEEEYELIGKLFVSSLDSESSGIKTFEWTPIWKDCFEDCAFTDTSKDYELKAVADCDDNVNESDETNNEIEEPEEVTVCYNGYMADEPLDNIAHGTLHGGLIFTTGDGEYGGLYSVGDIMDTTYEITLSAGASVKLARLNVYYTWHKDKESCPEMEVSIDGTVVPLDESYNDIKCWEPWNLPWGNYVYDIKDYIAGSGTYTITVERTGGSSFCIAAPGIVLVYGDNDAPMIEYWITEGADVLMGGRRADGGYLALEECLNTATFPEPEEPVDLEVEKATLGVVALWGEDDKNVLYFNNEELGEGVYCGYHDPYSSDEEIKGISMSIGGSEAQVGIAAFDVTRYLEDYDNEVIQGDDGDNMMPANAFLVITYEEDENEEEEKEGSEVTSVSPNITAWNPVDAVVNNTEGESRTFTISVNQTVDISWQINGTEVQTNESVTEAAYTNTSAAVGTWNVSAIATNTTTGLSDMHTWIWTVTPELTAVISDLNTEVEEGQENTPAENITTTPTSTPAITPTFTPTMEEKQKQKPGAEALVPGFELAISLLIVIAVAYLIRVRKRGGVE